MKRIITYTLIFLFININLFGQQEVEGNSKDYLWAVNANIGYSLLWGDAASQSYNPFARWFNSDESAFSYGINVQRKLNKSFKIQGGILMGSLNSYRDSLDWSDVNHPVTNSETSYFDGHIALNVDFTSLMGFKEDRLVSFYGLLGVGMVHYSATSYLGGVEQPDRTISGANTLMIPWGWGLDFRINEKFSINFENTFRNTFIDDLDAYEGQNSDFSDFYSITGVGLTYKFGEKREKEKPKVEIAPVEETDIQDDDSLVAGLEPVYVSFRSSIPKSVSPNTEYDVNSIINKEDLTSKGVYEMKIPNDFYISNIKTEGGKLEQDSSKFVVTWDEMPESNLMISYHLSVGGLEEISYTFDSKFTYVEDSIEKVKTFTNRVSLNEVVLVKNDTNSTVQDSAVAQSVTTTQDNTAALVSAPIIAVAAQSSNVEYRIQIAAVFGGTTSKGLLKKRLGLSQDVKEDPYKSSYRYTVGSYSSYGEAAQNRALSKVKGSYVVVFKDGKYIGGLAKVNKDVMDKDGLYESGMTYKIQIAASKGRPYPISRLAYKYGLKDSDITEDEFAGWFQYSFGKYRTKEEAKPALNSIKNKVPKAHIIKFNDGKR